MMKNRFRAQWALVAACALLGLVPAGASAAPTISKLRVEAGGALSPGVSYVNDTARLATAPSQCDGSGQTKTVDGPSAIGLVDYAQETNGQLRPYFISDQFDFGLIVCRIADVGAFDANQAWLYKVNHRAAQVGGDQFKLERRDEVLWYFANFANGRNTGDELDLTAPGRAKPGKFTVTARAYDSEGRARPAAQARISGGNVPVVTGPDGKAQVTVSKEGTATLRATRGTRDIPAAPTRVCIDDALARCPERPLEAIVGTNAADTILGFPSGDFVGARGGNDRIDVRGGGADFVGCGPGTDTVLGDSSDRVASDCERVSGAKRA